MQKRKQVEPSSLDVDVVDQEAERGRSKSRGHDASVLW